ncbi:MAG: peptidylprolyl isomerase [Bacteroidales bacterium]|nr:peptidylprolyl isomerase [Bacteroidales bacterium]
MKKMILLLALFATIQASMAEKRNEAHEDRAEVTMQTTQGKIVMVLYNETPIHRDNFLAQVRRGYYDGLLFHRIIASFMIQCGDSTSRDVSAQEFKNARGDDPYRLPAEIRFPQLFHRRGALAAARQGDHINLERKSSPYEFYIVWGKYFGPREMQAEQEKVLEREDSTRHFTFPQEVIDAYEIEGGTPHLDNEYTVFGEVIKGLDVVGQIQAAKTDSLDRPLKDIRIKKAWVSKERP